MLFNTNYPISDTEVSDQIKMIAATGGKMKINLFRTTMDRSNVSYNEIQSYLGLINSYLREFDQYADELQDKMKDINKLSVSDKINNIEYDDVKPYMYAHHDWASVLQFIDGLIKGLNNNDFQKPDDVREFFEHTVNKAFKDCGDNVAEMMEDTLISLNGPDIERMDAKEITMFNSTKSYKWYNSRDRVEIYKAIEKSIEFMCNYYSFGKAIDTVARTVDDHHAIKIAIIGCAFDYITYTLAAYGLRVYIMSQYVLPVMMYQKNTANIAPVHESVDILSGNITDLPISAVHEIDEMILQDVYKFPKFMEIIGKALKTCGGDGTGFDDTIRSDGNNVYAIITASNKGNIICDKLMSNSLHNCLTGMTYSWNISDGDPGKISEVCQMLRSAIYNNMQGIGTSFTPKQEIMHIYGNIKPKKDTLEGYQSLLTDLIRCGIILMQRLFMLYKEATEMYNTRHPRYNDRPFTITSNQELYDISKNAKDLYIEIGQVMLARARDLESNINNLRNANTNAIMADLSIKVPGLDTKKKSSEFADINSQIPGTNRTPISFIDIATESHYTELTMRDMYIMETYGLQNDVYFTEGLADQSNMIDSIFNQIITSIQKFFTNAKFTAARKWVQENNKSMMDATFKGTLNGITPYPKIINLDGYITNIQEKMKTINNELTKDKLAKADGVTAMVKTLYKDDATYNMFHDKNVTAEDRKTKFSNYILFGKEGQTVTNVTVPEVVNIDVSDAGFKSNYLKQWVDTILSTENVYKQLDAAIKECRESTKTMKQKLVQITGDTSTSSANGAGSTTTTSTAAKTESYMIEADATPSATPPAEAKPTEDTKQSTTSSNNTATSDASNDKKEEAVNDATNNASVLLNGTRKACSDLLLGIYSPMSKAITDQYKYIKLAYGLKVQ